MTSFERTGWRDQELSERHRQWGFNCPAADLDFLVVEYSLGLPVAIVEYKKIYASMPDIRHPTYRAIQALANASNIPFSIVFYDPLIWAFRVFPTNAKSVDFYKTDTFIELSEREYVESLYRIRGQAISEKLLSRMSNIKPGCPTPCRSTSIIPHSSGASCIAA